MEGGSSISKVSVEYHDPFNIFHLVAEQLQERFPLCDLNWKSSTRPLRSIDFLHVDLTAAEETERPDSKHGAIKSEHNSAPTLTPSERRHQIPGLRQTPYLKLFLLRCDDSENYRSSARKVLREWLKAHTPASQSSSSRSSQENHDAFEWLIVHVVLPNTAAASQPRVSGSASRPDSQVGEKSGNASKLLRRGSTTLLEKIKADFNVSNKSAPDRVEQIRLRAENLPIDAFPPKPQGATGDHLESLQEYSRSWQDLTAKLKALILSSFSLRVSQYEDDIRDRESQRALPGWNFCTFFMLKEGLLRGFESVGLVDDALVGYDELALGLDHAIIDENKDGGSERSDSFLKYTKEMKDMLLQSMTCETPSEVVWQSGLHIVSAARKDYRNMIVNSNVSRFDFQSYVFARQISILLRMSTTGTMAPRQPNPPATGIMGTRHLAALSELCQRATAFIAAAARTLKMELFEAAAAQGVTAPTAIIDNIIASHGFAVAEQVLHVTDAVNLEQEWSIAMTTCNRHVIDKPRHPERRSSVQQHTAIPVKTDDSIAMLSYLDAKLAARQRGEDDLNIALVNEVEILAGNRADLLLTQRYIVEGVAASKQWAAGVSRLAKSTSEQEGALGNVDVAGARSEAHVAGEALQPGSLRGVMHPLLLRGMSSHAGFSKIFEHLTASTMKQCVLALRPRLAERLCADIAVLRYDAQDFMFALNCLSKAQSAFQDHDWDLVGSELVRIHLKCLRKLNRTDTYVRMGLSALSKDAEHRKLKSIGVSCRPSPAPLGIVQSPATGGLLRDILDVSADLSRAILLPLTEFFVDLSVDPYIQHFRNTDGFVLKVEFRSLFSESVEAKAVRVSMKSIERPNRDILLETTFPTNLRPGMNIVELGAHITCSGAFTIEKVAIAMGKIVFEGEILRQSPSFLPNEESHHISQTQAMIARLPQIFCYPTEDCLIVSIQASRAVQMSRSRLLEIKVQTGRNNVQWGQLNLRAGSAGLRLMIADATAVDESVGLAKGKESGKLELEDLATNSTATITLPYDLESNLARISVGIEFQYTTTKGAFQYFSNPLIPVDLIPDISVHDLFKDDLLCSRFQIRASQMVPLLISSVQLTSSDHFAVQGQSCKLTPMLVLPQHDGMMLYKIKPRGMANDVRQSIDLEPPLEFEVEYRAFDEIVLAALQWSLLLALEQSAFKRFKHPLSQVVARFCRELDPDTLARTAMLRRLDLLGYEEMGWTQLLEGLDPSVRQSLEIWLRQWHAQVHALLLDDSNATRFLPPAHILRISVPLPRIQILHTVHLDLPVQDLVLQSSILIGTISVHHTRRWDSRSSTKSETNVENDKLDFVLYVDAPQDAWLVGGDRRTSYRAAAGEAATFNLMLVPLRTGRLLLPDVRVRWHGNREEEIGCETDFRSAGETVVVVPGVKGTTVGVRELIASTDVTMMNSERQCAEESRSQA